MATYNELATITEDAAWGGLFDKVVVATAIKATAIINSATPTQVALDWAKAALSDPKAAARAIVWFVIGDNAGLDIATIIGAADTAVQNKVNAAVDVLYP